MAGRVCKLWWYQGGAHIEEECACEIDVLRGHKVHFEGLCPRKKVQEFLGGLQRACWEG